MGATPILSANCRSCAPQRKFPAASLSFAKVLDSHLDFIVINLERKVRALMSVFVWSLHSDARRVEECAGDSYEKVSSPGRSSLVNTVR